MDALTAQESVIISHLSLDAYVETPIICHEYIHHPITDWCDDYQGKSLFIPSSLQHFIKSSIQWGSCQSDFPCNPFWSNISRTKAGKKGIIQDRHSFYRQSVKATRLYYIISRWNDFLVISFPGRRPKTSLQKRLFHLAMLVWSAAFS